MIISPLHGGAVQVRKEGGTDGLLPCSGDDEGHTLPVGGKSLELGCEAHHAWRHFRAG